jgi:isocitrate dehydrogenase
MMLRHLGWNQAADLIVPAITRAIAAGHVTYDLARQIPGARKVSGYAFAQAICGQL